MKPLSYAVATLFVSLAAVACASSSEDDGAEMAPSNFDAEHPTDETKSTHLWIVNRGIDILSKHTGDVASAANTVAWMKDTECRKNWQNGLLEADFLAPFNGAAIDLTVPNGFPADDVEAAEADFEVGVSHATWMSHFYDPTTGKNYLGFAKSSEIPDDPILNPIFSLIKPQIEVNGPVPVEAKGSALYRAGRAVDLLSGKDVKIDHKNEPQDKRARGCYELGLALHYMTDLAQPMHSSNFAATDRPRLLHSHWEGWAEKIQARFARTDWSAGPKGDLPTVVQNIAVASKARWVGEDGKPGALQKAVLDAYRAGGTFDAAGKLQSDSACDAAAKELAVAGFVSIDLQKCWQDNPGLVKATGEVLGEAQEMTARFLGTLALPVHR
jgi:phospholipase C